MGKSKRQASDRGARVRHVTGKSKGHASDGEEQDTGK